MTIISCYDTLMLTDSSVSAMLSNLRNYSDREVPKTPEIEALRKLDREATLDRSWWQKFFNPTKEELLEQIAEPTFVEKLVFNHPELVLGPASLGLSGLKTAGALALQRVAPRVLALGSVAPLWENLVNYMKGGKDAVKKPVSGGNAPRIQNSKVDADNYIKGLTDQKNLILNRGKIKDGYHYYEVMQKFEYKGIKFKKGDFVSRDTKHHEIEWFRGENQHYGALDPVTGQVKPRSIVPGRTLKTK